jgi:hypothetical protein
MAKQPKKKAATALPSGFRDVGGGNFPQAWTPSVGDSLHGVVTQIRRIPAKQLRRDNAKKGEMVTVVSVADKSSGELTSIFESKALESFCKEVRVGEEVFLRLDEVRKIGKKRFKAFTVGIKAKGKGK